MTEALIITILIVGIVAIGLAIIALLGFILLMKRTNQVVKKVDYLVEDITYKVESLNVAVDAVTKLSNYVLTLDSVTKKGFSSLMKLVSNNRNFFYSFVDKMKKDKDNKKTKGKK